jgi:hypothetical protein
MDDVVAVEVGLTDGGSRYFLTWGRIQDAVDPQAVCDLVLVAARRCALGGEPTTARLCDTLREAADSASAPYFYECYLGFARQSIPYGDEYESWREQKADAMADGREIAYCGRLTRVREGITKWACRRRLSTQN